MTQAVAQRAEEGGAPALRFLLLCLLMWMGARLVAQMGWAAPPAGLRHVPSAEENGGAIAAEAPAFVPLGQHDERKAPGRKDGISAGQRPALAASARHAGDKNRRLLPLTRLRAMERGASVPFALTANAPAAAPLAVTPALVAPGCRLSPPRDARAGWSASGWIFVHQAATHAAPSIAPGPQLGGSQAGINLAYGFGQEARLRAYGRATMAIDHLRQRELALGLAATPVRGLPVDVAIEQRLALGKAGRTALAAMVTGGVDHIALPAGLKLEAYGQAGVVGARRRDFFASGSMVVDHALGKDDAAPFRLGLMTAAAAQPGAARVDVGPRVTLRLPRLGQGARLALDWRERVAGDAEPDSGVAFTLAADF